jgi:hypothetical protein
MARCHPPPRTARPCRGARTRRPAWTRRSEAPTRT